MMDESEMTTEEKSWLFSEDVDDMSVKVEADSAAFPPVVSDVEVLPPKTEGDPVEIKDEANSVEVRADVKDLFSGSTPPPDLPRTRSTSPGVKHEGGVKDEDQSGIKQEEETKPTGPILIDDLPTAWDEAHETFVTLEKCVYERKDMGLSRESDEMMVCDCSFDKHDPSARACNEDTDCINRALFIECLPGECRAKHQCQNQRFRKRNYAPIEIVLTELKGYGLRAKENIPSGSLIYEYIGEVVKEQTFRKRMAQYAEEGIRHFYFMMLQKEEYIDATKKGGIGRFANHSCDPNSEVQKWVVGRRLRMGIFTKRDVVKGEEITFNYNVDRYGHDAQICYCGESNCVGFIGGKTQTDSSIGTMNDLFIDALGIADEVEALQLKGSKKKKSKQLDEDFIPTLKPIVEVEVQKVAAAMRQSGENGKMMSKLLQRINMTEEPSVHRQLMRMHGFGLMNMVLTQLAENREAVMLALESMSKWKLQIRNKVEDSGIETPVKALSEGYDEQLKTLAEGLLEYWSGLEVSYRIPRKSKIASLDEDDEAATTTIAENDSNTRTEYRRPQAWENTVSITMDIAPVKPRLPAAPRPRVLPPPPPPLRSSNSHSNPSSSDRSKLDAIIAMAQQSVSAAAAAAAAAGNAPSDSPAAESSRSGSRAREEEEEERRRKRKRRESRGEEDERKKEKRLKLLVGEVVVRSMTKYKEQMDHETFKRYARECTELLVEKEKKGSSYTSHRHPTLSDEKQAKMKAFTKEFVHKLLKKLKEKGKLRRPGGSSSRSHRPSASTSTPGGESMTPGATPSRTDSSSVVLQTPEPSGDHDDLVNDIFGDDDGGADDAMDLDGDSDMDSPAPIRNGPVKNGMARHTSSLAGTASPSSTPAVDANGNGADHPQSMSPSTQSTVMSTPTPTPQQSFGGIGVGAIKVDSFRPIKVAPQVPSVATLSTPSRTPTSEGDPSPGGV